MKTYTICEYQSFTRDIAVNNPAYQTLPKAVFDSLKQFVVESNPESATDALDLMSVSYRKNIGEIITAKNYVGVIAMADGTVIEVLPKIANAEINTAKMILLNMLRTVKELPFKSFLAANLDVSRLSIFEIFISMFISEVKSLLQKGLKSDYLLFQDNEKFLKGKLLFHKHIKHNLVHKERFFVEYHLYNIDRAENRIIKTTLEYLFRLSNFAKNKKEIRMLLNLFDDVSVSKNIEADFKKCSNGRDMKAYEQVLKWCEIFLQGNSFTNLRGKHLAVSLLFPMEKLFESYIAEKFSNALDCHKFKVSVQDSRYHLFERKFALRPDIVVESKGGDTAFVLDTKWKLLNINIANYGISQADMYQMYAYGKKYKADKVMLIYPYNEMVANLKKPIEFASKDGVQVSVSFVDLLRNNCMDSVLEKITEHHIIAG